MALVEVVAHLRANADNMVAGFRRAQGAANQFGSTMNQTAGVTQRGFSMMSKYAMLGATAMQGAAVAGATMGVKFAMANEQAIISFKTLLGSQQEAEAMFKSLQEFAATTPFEFPQLRDAASKLLTTGVEAERVIPIMTALGDSTAAMGTGAEGIQRAVYALQQMNLIGKITGQDMMQLANAGIPAWDALASAAGMSVQEVKKAVERGTLQNSVQLLMQGIESYSGEAMGRVKGMMAEQSQTLVGLMSTLKDNVNIALGDMMKPATSAIKQALPAINDAVGNTFRSMTEPVNALVTRMMEAFTKLIPAIGPTMLAMSQIMTAALESIVPIVVSVASVLPSLTPALESISEAMRALGEAVGPLISELLVTLIPLFVQVFEVIAEASVFVLEHDTLLKTLTVTIGALAAGYVAFRAASTVIKWVGMAKDIAIMIGRVLGLTVAVNAQTVAERRLAAAQAAQAAAAMGAAGAQTALNTAMIANPIGLIIAAIVALVAAVVIMWRKFEWFRLAMASVWNFIVSAVQKAIDLVLGYWEFFINRFIKTVNFMIRAWNKLPFGDDIPELKEINLQLDIMGAQIDKNALKSKDVTAELEKQKKALKALQDVNAKWDKVAGTPPKPPKPPTPAGADEKTVKAMAKLREQIKSTYENGIKKAKDSLESLKQEHQEYNDQIQKNLTNSVNLTSAFDKFTSTISQMGVKVYEAIGGMLNFADVVSQQEAAVNALSQAQAKQSEIQQEVNDAEAELGKLQAKYARTRNSKDRLAMLEEIRSATERLQAAQAKLAESETAVASAQDDATKAGGSFLAGLRKQVNAAKAFGEQIKRLRELNLNETALQQIIQAGAVAGGKIADELIAGGVDAIRSTNDLTVELDQFAKDTGSSVQQSFAATGKTMAQSLLDAMQEQATKAGEFATKVKTLVEMGLSKENIENVVQAGADAGGQIADALIAGGTPAITRANEIKTSLDNIAKTAAETAGSAYYSAGEALAAQLVKGLEEKWKTLQPKLEGMTLPQLQTAAKNATDAVSGTVEQIKAIEPSQSPVATPPAPQGKSRDEWRKIFVDMVNKQFSKKWKTVTEYINAGANAASKKARRERWEDFVKANNVPDMADGGIVRATPGGRLVRIGEAGRNEAVIPLSSAILSKMGGGGTTIQVTVQAGMGTDGAEVGKQIVRILQDYERKNGKIPVRAQR